MRKTVWLIIQDNSLPENGSHCRHYYFARYLVKKGYNPIVFVASKSRCSTKQMIEDRKPFQIDDSHGFPFVYIRTCSYEEGMKDRLRAMVEFHARLYRYANRFPQPDVILGSSAYPLSPLLAIKLAKRYRCKSICEVRDLWPLSLEEYGLIPANGGVARIMYRLEKYLYCHADELVFTFPGGGDYIAEKGWDTLHGGLVDPEKIHCIGNGVDLDEFTYNEQHYSYTNDFFSKYEGRKILYTGSVRQANSLGFLLDMAKVLNNERIAFFIFGDGVERPVLEQRCKTENITNVFFLGKIDKRSIPSVLSQGTMTILLYSRIQESLARYGTSQNKLSEYLACGKPVLSCLPSKYSVVNTFDCGCEASFETPEAGADCIREMLNDAESLSRWGDNAQEAAKLFSYEKLTENLINVIEK